MSVEISEETATGPLTGHRVRFDGIEGRAGSFYPASGEYMVALDSGFERALKVNPKHFEDLGTYDDPMATITSIFEDVPCVNSTSDNPHNAKRVIRSPFAGPFVCSKCKLEAAKAVRVARGEKD